MYTPPQWRSAAPPVLSTLGVCAAALIFALFAHNSVILGIAGGVIAGLLAAIAWTVRRFVPWVSALLTSTAILLLAGLWAGGEPPGSLLALGIGLIIWCAWVIGYGVVYSGRFHRETPTPIASFGADTSCPRALIVFHSAHRGFQRAMQPLLAEALASKGWRVDMTTASRDTPSELAPYDLIVLGAPAYNWKPAKPVMDYARRVGDFKNKPCALIVSGGGMTAQAMRALRARVEARHGRVVEALELWTARANPARFGASEPVEIMRGLGRHLAARDAQ